jgi:uncharacterized protein with ATP-grasp and redox domains
MTANPCCISCLLTKYEKQARPFPDDDTKKAYLRRLLKLLYEEGDTRSAPELSCRMDAIYRSYYPVLVDYAPIKHRYNQYMLSKEALVEAHITTDDDPLAACVRYVCAGNYIDFGANNVVDDRLLDQLLDKAARETVDAHALAMLKQDLSDGKTLVYLTDNCGEIVMDKLFVRHIRAAYPHLDVTVIVRGGPALNDATMIDAEEVGMTTEARCMGNGAALPGTILSTVNRETLDLLHRADVIIAKGQGNFESLFGEGLNPYFLFLCKCDLFVRRFGMEKYASVFAREDHIRIYC